MKNLKKLLKKIPRTIELKGEKLFIIDQRLLPAKLKIIELKNCDEAAIAIKTMKIRGAEAIGAAAAGGIFLTVRNYSGKSLTNMKKNIQQAAKKIKRTRPTAVNLFWAIDQLLEKIKAKNVVDFKKEILKKYQDFLSSEEEDNLLIGKVGNQIIKNGARILTHCNAGSLSSIWFGTGLAPIFSAHLTGKKIKVLINETRPWLQGVRLTAWEMWRAGINHQVNIDSAAGYLMQQKKIDLVLVGADRVAANGDTANKIGTYTMAVLAKENKIPFYVSADSSTIDFKTSNGQKIKIEERSGLEIIDDFRLLGERISHQDVKTLNPVFDITPARYITGIITEFGIFKPSQIKIIKKKLNI